MSTTETAVVTDSFACLYRRPRRPLKFAKQSFQTVLYVFTGGYRMRHRCSRLSLQTVLYVFTGEKGVRVPRGGCHYRQFCMSLQALQDIYLLCVQLSLQTVLYVFTGVRSGIILPIPLSLQTVLYIFTGSSSDNNEVIVLSLQTVLYVFTGARCETMACRWLSLQTVLYVFIGRISSRLSRQMLSSQAVLYVFTGRNTLVGEVRHAVITDSFVCLYRSPRNGKERLEGCRYRQFCISLQDTSC